MSNTGTEHVRLLDGAFHCTHCGARYRMNQPCPINVFAAAGNAFVADHTACVTDAAPSQGQQLDLLKGCPQ